MEKNILILTTTNEFLGKFERENVRILKRMGYCVHYAANMDEPHYISDQERIRKMGVMVHSIAIVRSPYMVKENRKALCQLLELIEKFSGKSPKQSTHRRMTMNDLYLIFFNKL